MKNSIISKLDIKNSFIVEWAFLRLEYLRGVKNQKELEHFETSFLNSENVLYLLEKNDNNVLNKLFSALPSERFSKNLEIIVNKWIDWEGKAAFKSGVIISILDPKRAYELFSANLPSFDKSFDTDRLKGIIACFEFLESKHAGELIGKLIENYMNSYLYETDYIYFSVRLLEYAWKYDIPSFKSFFRQVLFDELYEKNETYKKVFANLCRVFVGTEEDFVFIDYCMEEMYNYSCISNLFNESAPLGKLDKIIDSLYSDDIYEEILVFFNNNYDVIADERVRNFLKEIINDKELVERIDDEFITDFFIFILACLAGSMRKKELREEDLNIEIVFNLLTAEIKEIPFFDVLAGFLKKQNKEEIIKLLSKHVGCGEDFSKSLPFVVMMGEVGYEEFIPLLADLLDGELRKAAEDSLILFGDKASLYLKRNLKSLGRESQSSAIKIIEYIDKEKVVEFVLENFSDLFLCNKEPICSIINFYPDERFIEKLEPFANKGNFSIDTTWVLLNKFFLKETPLIKSMEKKVWLQKSEKEEKLISIMKGHMRGVKPYIDLELKCSLCGDESIYRVKEVAVNYMAGDKVLEAFIREIFPCINCNKYGEFEVTPIGRDIVLAEILRFSFMDNEGQEEFLSITPISFLNRTIEGKSGKIGDIIKDYLLEIEKAPDLIDNYIGVANIYFNIGRYNLAEEYYKKAFDISPLYITPYYSLGRIAAKRENYKEAFKWLNDGLKYLETCKVPKKTDVSLSNIRLSHVELYNDVAKRTGNRIISVKKIKPPGRNSPCPCGSGKKYKKCCL